MKLVKLDAINSTNSFLKLLAKEEGISNWTVVSTEFQSKGRGQVKTIWESERGKNLMCSILLKLKYFKVSHQFYLNCAISIGIFNALLKYNLPELKVKWPNDIMSGNKKLAGILIENSLTGNRIHQSVIGIGLNINQKKFSDDLPNAISMAMILDQNFDRNTILEDVVFSIKTQIELLEQNKFTILHQNYELLLYKMSKVNMFEDAYKKRFVGVIQGVSEKGKLIVEVEDKNIKTYNFKDIKFL